VSENNELGEQFVEVKPKGLRGRLGRAIKGGVSEARFKLASRRERKRLEKARIKQIEAQEMRSLQRAIIRKKVKRKLERKFLPQEFKLKEARRKRELEGIKRGRKKLVGNFQNQQGRKTVGDQILENLGGFGIRPAIPKKKKQKPRQIVLRF
jgi:hypothetical protein